MNEIQSFTEPLDIRYDPAASKILGADHWRVISPFRYYLGEKYSEQWVMIPAGYLTDGASVPRLLWNMIPPWGSYGQAAVVHDYLCENLQIMVAGKSTPITRTRCDEILNEAMQVLGVPTLLRLAIYHGVCLYRTVARIDQPSGTALKRSLEAAWPAIAPTVGATA